MRLASPTLAAHGDSRAESARRRYGKRAAFRATPQGLLAGVAMAQVTEGPSQIALGDPSAHVVAGFQRISTVGRALLETDLGWRSAKLRVAPSLLRDERRVIWLAFGEGAEARQLEADRDELLDRILDATSRWVGATGLAKRLAGLLGSAQDAKSHLLLLIDDGLLHHDLEPPLAGTAPHLWAAERYASLMGPEELARLGEGPGVVATLLHHAEAPLTISAAPLARAAKIAPVLFALAEALHAPVFESALSPGVEQAFDAASAWVGEGLLSLTSLALGHHGVRVDVDHDSVARAPYPPVVAWLANEVVKAARAQCEEIDLADVEPLLVERPRPPTFELQLQPCVTPKGGVEGDDWLLGLHGPAGASWGRFHGALGAPLIAALEELHHAEQQLDADAVRVDLAYAPSRELADLCQVPALRQATLAISSWPEQGALLPAQCAIANEPQGPAHRGIAAAGTAVVVSPLHRVRSSTAPPSVYRNLIGDTFVRQHAPWAFSWGPLARSTWLPRVRISGFVVSPQSWALPSTLDDASIASWRATEKVSRWVQVGAEDVLLPLDLGDPLDRQSLRELAATGRVFEIWPPLGTELDAKGRRVELIAAVLDANSGADARNQRLASLAITPTPADAALPAWRTVKLFAPRDRHCALLAQVVPLLERLKPVAWFFLPYVDEPGGRAHLRLRISAVTDKETEVLAARLTRSISIAMPKGDLVATEIAAFYAEHARYGEALRTLLIERGLTVSLCDERSPRAALIGALGYGKAAAGLPADLPFDLVPLYISPPPITMPKIPIPQ